MGGEGGGGKGSRVLACGLPPPPLPLLHPRPSPSTPGLPLAEVFNNAIIAKRGEEAAAAVAARVPDATSDVAVFYIAHPPHEAARSRPPTPTGAQAAARESKGA